MRELVRRLNEASDAYYSGKEEVMSNYEWMRFLTSFLLWRRRRATSFRQPHAEYRSRRRRRPQGERSVMSFRPCPGKDKAGSEL